MQLLRCSTGPLSVTTLPHACTCVVAALLQSSACSVQQSAATSNSLLATAVGDTQQPQQHLARCFSSQAAAAPSHSSKQQHKSRQHKSTSSSSSRFLPQTPRETPQQPQQQHQPATQLQKQLQRLRQQQLKKHHKGQDSTTAALSSSRQPQQQQLQPNNSIPDGQLQSLIAASQSITDIEAVVLQYHRQFKFHHIAAAVQKLPTLDMESSLNKKQRFTRLASLLASALGNVSRLFDPHQATGCLAALTSPRCLPPMRHGPLLQLLLLLLEDDAARLRQLHSYELAQCAAAAAAMQDAIQQQQQQQQRPRRDVGAAAAQQQDPAVLLPHASSSKQQQQSGGQDDAAALDLNALSLLQQQQPDGGSSSSGGGTAALALQDPLQRFWQALHNVITPQLSMFSADSLALTALSFAAGRQASRDLMLGVTHAALARPQKFEESPVAVCRMLKALVLSDHTHEDLLAVLASAVATTARRSSYSLSQLADAATAFASVNFYHETALDSICWAATRSLKSINGGAQKSEDVVSLLTSLEALRFRHEPFMKAAARVLATAAAAVATVEQGQQRQQLLLRGNELAASLAALIQLGFSGQALEGLLQATLRLVARTQSETSVEDDSSSSSSSGLSAAGTIKLLWAAAVLEEPAASILPLLLGGLKGVAPEQLSQRDLRLLYQAHRLLDHSWVVGSGSSDDPRSTSSNSPSVNMQQQQRGGSQAQEEGWWQRHTVLLSAAREAAGLHAAASASRSKQQARAVQDAFEGLGYDAPVKGLKVDGGGLRPDLAFVVAGTDAASTTSSSSIGSGGVMKVALMCDHGGRFSRNAPHELLGYWRVAEWLLQLDGWRIVRFPAHEWRALLSDREAREGATQLSYVFNTMAAQGVPLG